VKLASTLRVLSFAAFALLAAPSLRAQDVLKLTDGTVLRGRATRYDEASRTVTFVTDDGATRSLAIDKLDRLSAYKIAKARAPETDAQGQLKIANFARDAELYRYALRHYDNARKADPSLAPTIDKELATLRREAADYCMRNAQDSLAKNDSAGAEKWLTLMVEKLPNETQSAQAAGMLDQLYAKNHAAKVQKVEQSTPDLIKSELADGKKSYDSMIEKIRFGLANSPRRARPRSPSSKPGRTARRPCASWTRSRRSTATRRRPRCSRATAAWCASTWSRRSSTARAC
jgi:cell division septum initiation protein DivIVA